MSFGKNRRPLKLCELLGMSANVPTDITFSFRGLAVRGGQSGPHRDGFGIVFYRGKGIQEFRDEAPSCQSPVAELVQNLPIRSTNVIAHVRQANAGAINLENTHPFIANSWGVILPLPTMANCLALSDCRWDASNPSAPPTQSMPFVI